MGRKDPLRVGDKVFRHVLDDHVTESDLEKARTELNETPERRKEALEQLRDMLANEKDLNPCTDEIFLLRFLRVRKFNCEDAFKSVKNFYSFRLKYPKLFQSPTHLEKVVKNRMTSFLPYRDVEGRIIFIHKLEPWNPEEVSLSDYLCAMQLLAESVLDYPVSQINGYATIFDLKGFSLVHFKQLAQLGTIFMALGMLQGYFPVRSKIMLVVNSSRLFQIAYSFFYPFMKEKFKKRVLFSTYEDLHSHLDPSIVPEEYGGTLPNYDFEELAQQALDKENFFERDRAFGYK